VRLGHPKTLQGYNSKWPEVKIVFFSNRANPNILELYPVKGFYQGTLMSWCFCIIQATLIQYCCPIASFTITPCPAK
jgi:hypothetical protein